jgi:hypothetical protein
MELKGWPFSVPEIGFSVRGGGTLPARSIPGGCARRAARCDRPTRPCRFLAAVRNDVELLGRTVVFAGEAEQLEEKRAGSNVFGFDRSVEPSACTASSSRPA